VSTFTIPTNMDNVIDSRDVIAAVRAFEIDEVDPEGYASLRALNDQGWDTTDEWGYGATMVRDTYFVHYAKELAEECGVEPLTTWPHYCIDWQRAAAELRMDYTPIEFDGVTYWVR
jgi:hypothetical protein